MFWLGAAFETMIWFAVLAPPVLAARRAFYWLRGVSCSG